MTLAPTPPSRHRTRPAARATAGALAVALALAAGPKTAAGQQRPRPESGRAPAERPEDAAPPADSADQQPPRPDLWQATAELTVTDASGNQSLRVLTAGFGLRRRQQDTYAFDLRLQARYGSSEGERVAESYRGNVVFEIPRADRRWAPFLRSAVEHDPFKRLDVRVNSGAGATLRLYRADEGDGRAAASLALLHSYEAIEPETGRMVHTTARWSIRVDGQRSLGEGVTVTHTSHYQPVYDDAADYLLTMETGLRVMLTRRVALSLSYEYDRDSTPAEGVGRDDRLLKTGVLVEL